MHYISVNGFSFNFPNQCSFYKHGCAQRTEVPRKDLSFKKDHGCATNPLRSHSKNIGVSGISTRNYNKSETMLSFYWYRFLHERKRVAHIPSLATEIGFTHDDANNKDDKFAMFFNHLNKHLNAFYHFSRPHTIIGTLIGVTSVSLLPIHSVADLSLEFLIGWLKALIPSVLMNIYVVGLNQLFDVQIDKVNKPDLPLASGEFSMGVGTMIVSLSCLLSFGLGFAAKSPPLLMALFTSFLLGSIYSIDLPMLRWKRQPILATACIVTVRALMLQLAFFMHTQKYVLGRPIMLTRSVLFATTFMCFFVTVIALFKDIPDVDGDKHFGIKSFSVTLGKEKVFWLCIKLLLGAYGFAIALGANSPALPAMKLATIIGHSTLATMLLVRAQFVDLGEKASITSFYMFIWKLFYAEYFLIPLIRC